MFGILLSVPAVANATENELNANLNEFAQCWIDQNYSTNTEVKEIIPILDGYNQNIGYSISFESNGQPAGYVILDTRYEDDTNPVSEFSLEGEDWYTLMTNVATVQHSNIKAKPEGGKKLHSDSFYNYGVEIKTSKGYKVMQSSGKLEAKDNYIKKSKDFSDKVKQHNKKVKEKIKKLS